MASEPSLDGLAPSIVLSSTPGNLADVPLVPRVQQSGQLGKSFSRPPPVSRGAEIILLIDDARFVRTLTQLVLQGYGYSVLEAANGDEVVEFCRRHQEPVRLLVTDVVTAGLGGREFAERLQRLHPEMKVLYLSECAEDSMVGHVNRQEQVSVMQKPFSPIALGRKVREILA